MYFHLLLGGLLGNRLLASLLGHGGGALGIGVCWRLLSGLLGNGGCLGGLLLVVGQLSVLLKHGRVRVELEKSANVLEGVGLDDCASHLPVGGPQDLADFLGLEELGKIGDCHLGHGQVPVLLGLGRLPPGTVDGVQLLEGALGPDAESADVTAGCKLEEVQLLDVDGVDAGDVTEGTSQTL